MAGPREDGTFAEDKRHHPNRRVGAKSCAVCGIKQREYESPNSSLRGEPCEDEFGRACGHSWM